MKPSWREIGSWFVVGAVMLSIVHWFHLFSQSDISALHFPSTGAEAKVLLEILSFVGGCSAVVVGVKLAATRFSAGEDEEHYERRHAHVSRVSFFLLLALGFSLTGLLLWLSPLDRTEQHLNEGFAVVFGIMFGLMTLLTGLGVLLALKRRRLFERRRHPER